MLLLGFICLLPKVWLEIALYLVICLLVINRSYTVYTAVSVFFSKGERRKKAKGKKRVEEESSRKRSERRGRGGR